MTTQTAGTIPEWTQGDRLRKARQVTGMTTRQFADAIGVSQATVTNAENDHTKVRKITLNAWSLATGVPVEWLQAGTAPGGPHDGNMGDNGSEGNTNWYNRAPLALVGAAA